MGQAGEFGDGDWIEGPVSCSDRLLIFSLQFNGHSSQCKTSLSSNLHQPSELHLLLYHGLTDQDFNVHSLLSQIHQIDDLRARVHYRNEQHRDRPTKYFMFLNGKRER